MTRALLPRTVRMLQPELPSGFTHKREYYSYSSLDLYMRCPQAYKARYVDKHLFDDVEQIILDPNSPAELGTLVHRALELGMQKLWSRKHTGPVSRHAAVFLDCLNDAFREQASCSADLFQEGQQILQDWLPSADVYHDQLRGLEWPFELLLEDSQGDIVIKGFIDRLEITPDGLILIRDYKTNRMLFTADELRTSLQGSIYEMAIRDTPLLSVHREQPCDIEFLMLRHGAIQRTTRSPEQLNRAFTLVVGLVRKIEATRTFPAHLNKWCGYCEYRSRCEVWRQLITNGMPETWVDLNDISAVAAEYERLTDAAKALYRRKEEMADLMKIHLIGQDAITTNERIYRNSRTKETAFPDPYRVARMFGRAYNRSTAHIVRRLMTVKKSAFDELRKSLEGRLRAQELHDFDVEMAQLMEVTPAPRLQSCKNPGTGKKTTKHRRASQQKPGRM